MNERLPYEESLNEQLNDLPLPDQEQSWQKMKMLLEEDDNDRKFPPIFLKGCMGWGLVLLTMLVVLWFVIYPQKRNGPNSAAGQSERLQEKVTSKTKRSVSITPAATAKSVPTIPSAKTATDRNNETKNANAVTAKEEFKSEVASSTQATGFSLQKPARQANKSGPVQATAGQKNEIKKAEKQITDNEIAIPVNKADAKKANDEIDTGGNNKADSNQDSVRVIQNRPEEKSASIKIDSVKKQKEDTTRVDQEKAAPEERKKANNNKKYYFTAGLGLQQQIPLNGQKANPYNYYGRKGSLADYIPSVYFQLHREEKWFVQTGFRFGAPQSVREISYSQNSVTLLDSIGGSITSTTTTTTSTLKKTFYHQVPISFNYFILPNWSAGAGVLYSRFFGAVSEKEQRKRDNFNQTEIITKQIVEVPANTDSFFRKSQLQLLFQTEYQWRKFSFGLRYTKGLQPFISYTTPAGIPKQEKNESFQLMIRFRLWKQ